MKNLLLIIFVLLSCNLRAQTPTVGQIRYDTTKILKVGGYNELKVQNNTKDSTGGIFTNVGNGWGKWLVPRAVPGGIVVGLDTITLSGANYNLYDVTHNGDSTDTDIDIYPPGCLGDDDHRLIHLTQEGECNGDSENGEINIYGYGEEEGGYIRRRITPLSSEVRKLNGDRYELNFPLVETITEAVKAATLPYPISSPDAFYLATSASVNGGSKVFADVEGNIDLTIAGGTQDLQSVTDIGPTTTNDVNVGTNFKAISQVDNDAFIHLDLTSESVPQLKVQSADGQSISLIGTGNGQIAFNDGSFTMNLNGTGLSDNRNATFQDASGTIAYLSDITGGANTIYTGDGRTPTDRNLSSGGNSFTHDSVSTFKIKNSDGLETFSLNAGGGADFKVNNGVTTGEPFQISENAEVSFNTTNSAENTFIRRLTIHTAADVADITTHESNFTSDSDSSFNLGGSGAAWKDLYLKPQFTTEATDKYWLVTDSATGLTQKVLPQNVYVAPPLYMDVDTQKVNISVLKDSLQLNSGTYTPTITDGSNIASSLAQKCTWTRNGNIVTVFGQVQVITSLAAGSDLQIELPVASDLSSGDDLTGVASFTSALGVNGYVIPDQANNTAQLTFTALSVAGSGTVFFIFSYEIL